MVGFTPSIIWTKLGQMEEVCMDITENANLTTFPVGKVIEDPSQKGPQMLEFTLFLIRTTFD